MSDFIVILLIALILIIWIGSILGGVWLCSVIDDYFAWSNLEFLLVFIYFVIIIISVLVAIFLTMLIGNVLEGML